MINLFECAKKEYEELIEKKLQDEAREEKLLASKLQEKLESIFNVEFPYKFVGNSYTDYTEEDDSIFYVKKVWRDAMWKFELYVLHKEEEFLISNAIGYYQIKCKK